MNFLTKHPRLARIIVCAFVCMIVVLALAKNHSNSVIQLQPVAQSAQVVTADGKTIVIISEATFEQVLASAARTHSSDLVQVQASESRLIALPPSTGAVAVIFYGGFDICVALDPCRSAFAYPHPLIEKGLCGPQYEGCVEPASAEYPGSWAVSYDDNHMAKFIVSPHTEPLSFFITIPLRGR